MAKKKGGAKKAAGSRSKGFSLPNKLIFACIVLLVGLGVYLTNAGRDFSREGMQDRLQSLADEAKQRVDGMGGDGLYEPTRPTTVTYVPDETSLIYGGFPEPTGGLSLLQREGFMVAYDEGRENPAWVAYKLAGPPRFPSTKRPSRFSTDDETRVRVSHDDYTGTGYDRGHMAPNFAICTYYGPEAQEQTFLMSNIVPQDPDLNQGPWRELEEQIATTFTERFDAVYVITGPVYDHEREMLPKRDPKDPNNVEIPDAFFQVIVGQKADTVQAMGILMPQEAGRRDDWRDYVRSIDEIEAMTGYDFMSKLPDDLENRLESAKAAAW
ncbi:MAG: DNA/RNA non-specific endonuclease [Verrucomicrobiota bacterium JB022]|nr:DNA/RNA non-specific endonuclease [Verrucomicrobiota bacterium JB022]